MTPVAPDQTAPDGWRFVIFAKDQPEYTPLPALVSPEGVVETEWAATPDELEVLLTGGRIRVLVHTFNAPLQPFRVDVVLPDMRES